MSSLGRFQDIASRDERRRENWLWDCSGLGGLPVYVSALIVSFSARDRIVAYHLAEGLALGGILSLGLWLAGLRLRWFQQAVPSRYTLRGTLLWTLIAYGFPSPSLILMAPCMVALIGWTRVQLEESLRGTLAGVLLGLCAAAAAVLANVLPWAALARTAGF